MKIKLQCMIVKEEFDDITFGLTEEEKIAFFQNLADLSQLDLVAIGMEEYEKVMSRDINAHLN